MSAWVIIGGIVIAACVFCALAVVCSCFLAGDADRVIDNERGER